MLTESEYNQLKPIEEKLKAYSLSKAELEMVNTIKQRLRLGAICFSCTGSVMNAIREMLSFMELYEETK